MSGASALFVCFEAYEMLYGQLIKLRTLLLLLLLLVAVILLLLLLLLLLLRDVYVWGELLIQCYV